MSFRATGSLAEQIAQHLGNQIIYGYMQPGDRVQELRIAKELEVSRGSVREAFLILERRFLLEIAPRKGAMVSQLNREVAMDLRDAVIVALQTVAVKVCSVWRGEDLRPFVTITEQLEKSQCELSSAELINNVNAFYQTTYNFLNNPFLEQILDDLLPPALRIVVMASRRSDFPNSIFIKFFRSVVQAIHERDAAGSKTIIADFVEQIVELAMDTIEEQIPEEVAY